MSSRTHHYLSTVQFYKFQYIFHFRVFYQQGMSTSHLKRPLWKDNMHSIQLTKIDLTFIHIFCTNHRNLCRILVCRYIGFGNVFSLVCMMKLNNCYRLDLFGLRDMLYILNLCARFQLCIRIFLLFPHIFNFIRIFFDRLILFLHSHERTSIF